MIAIALRSSVREELEPPRGDDRPRGHARDAAGEAQRRLRRAKCALLRERQTRGEIPLTDYAQHVWALKARFPLLGLPLELWDE